MQSIQLSIPILRNALLSRDCSPACFIVQIEPIPLGYGYNYRKMMDLSHHQYIEISPHQSLCKELLGTTTHSRVQELHNAT